MKQNKIKRFSLPYRFETFFYTKQRHKEEIGTQMYQIPPSGSRIVTRIPWVSLNHSKIIF